MTFEEIKKKLDYAADAWSEKIIGVYDTLLKNPELGYCEEKTSSLVRKYFDELGIAYEYPLAVTGVKGRLGGRQNKFNVCIIGEMDALKCAGNPASNELGYAHACGHNAQIAAMLGCAAVFAESGVMKELDGSVTFMAVPAEEFIDLEFRRRLRNEGRIKYFGGKQQLIYEGAFDDTDMAIMIHAQPNEPEARLYTRGHNLGFLEKTVTFRGKAAHGSDPFDGVNALNAASLAIIGIHSNRETFREEDRIRIHPIITKGGEVVNSVPDEVCIDTYVRGASLEAIKKGSAAFDRSARGASLMVGAEVEIEDIPGYLPINEDLLLTQVFESCAEGYVGRDNIICGKEITGSTDIGDLSYILPAIQPSIGGFSGGLHSVDFAVCNNNTACVLASKIMAATAAMLLYDGAKKAENIKNSFKPRMSKEEYIEYLNNRKE